MNESQDTESAREHLWTLLREIRFALLTTISAEGQVSSRPLTTQNERGDRGGVLYFFVSAASPWVSDVVTHPQVGIGYADPGNDRYVSISGRARVARDPARQAALWSPLAQAWFPDGSDDPALRLLEVEIDSAEYWDVKASKMVQLLVMAKAAVTRQAPTDLGEHRNVPMG